MQRVGSLHIWKNTLLCFCLFAPPYSHGKHPPRELTSLKVNKRQKHHHKFFLSSPSPHNIVGVTMANITPFQKSIFLFFKTHVWNISLYSRRERSFSSFLSTSLRYEWIIYSMLYIYCTELWHISLSVEKTFLEKLVCICTSGPVY